MPTKRIAIVVGNGLTIDLVSRQAAHIRSSWNTSTPLQWRIPATIDLPSNWTDPTAMPLGRRFIEAKQYEMLYARIDESRSANPDASDFALVTMAVAPFDEPETDQKARIRRLLAEDFLALAFSHFDRYAYYWVQPQLPWVEWLRKHRRWLEFVVSYNYDRVLECCLAAARVPFGRCGLREEDLHGGIPILKPHGSIDFGVDTDTTFGAGVVFKNSSLINSNVPQRRLSSMEMIQHRLEVNLVLPGMLTHLGGHQAVAPGYDAFTRDGPAFTHLLLLGISYWDVDRPEIDLLLDSLNPSATVIIANPYPPAALRAAVMARNLKCEEWIDGPRDLGS